ncbi:helix-turn-helix domain-containing protein [Scytonema sp. PCC 10023]|uniref:helix-turn-helix domain-containing protein n=1 Tax=Scytonema sp. PCC 10023 TaxID=1680591 RepID=UPI0039C75BB1
MPNEQVKLIDFQQEGASNLLFPKPAILSSDNAKWMDIHFELHQQPEHDTTAASHTMHTIATALSSTSTAERWMDGCFQRELLNQGDTAIIPAGTLHRSTWRQQVQFMFVAFEPALLKQAGQEIVNPDCIELIPHFATVQDPLIQGILLNLKEELESGGIGGSLYVDQLKTTLALHLLRKYCTCTPRIATYSDGLPKYKLQQALGYINAHLEQDIQLADLAELLGMSRYYFVRLFKHSMGITPYQYVLQQRIERAKMLLKHRERAISDIALECGFANQSHFTKHFRQFTGRTPKAYQKR